MPDALTDQSITLTLPRSQWSLIVWLAGQGIHEVTTQYLESRGHKIDCITEAVAAVKALQDLMKAAIPNVERAIAEDLPRDLPI